VDEFNGASSNISVDTEHADMRVEIVKRELNQGALAGMNRSITDYAALLVIAALDSYDAHAYRTAYHRGFRDGFKASGRLWRASRKAARGA
jgi:hypothetical protein